MRRTTTGALALAILLSAAPAASAHTDPWPVPAPFGLDNPAPYGQETDGFGRRWGRMHEGLDIGLLQRLAVLAAADGTVARAGVLPGYEGYGLVVLLDHGGGRQTLYAHLSRVRVREGERVEAGAWIGNAGCSGSCTGTHLHFELRERGRAVDPTPFLHEPIPVAAYAAR